MSRLLEVQYLARLPLTGISDRDAARLWMNPEAYVAWMANHHISSRSPEAVAVLEQGDAALDRGILDEQKNLEPEGYSKVFRADAQALCDFVAASPRLPRRLAEVFDLCVRQGMSLKACAERLHIKRETVRAHLRRLRLLRRRYVH